MVSFTFESLNFSILKDVIDGKVCFIVPSKSPLFVSDHGRFGFSLSSLHQDIICGYAGLRPSFTRNVRDRGSAKQPHLAEFFGNQHGSRCRSDRKFEEVNHDRMSITKITHHANYHLALIAFFQKQDPRD